MSPQGHGKVISRSQQGQSSSKGVQICCFLLFLVQRCSLEKSIRVNVEGHIDPGTDVYQETPQKGTRVMKGLDMVTRVEGQIKVESAQN